MKKTAGVDLVLTKALETLVLTKARSAPHPTSTIRHRHPTRHPNRPSADALRHLLGVLSTLMAQERQNK